ncbi:MAG: peptidase M23 [Deltaproteobacteria bacterium]|nr:peptidase M23 [Deltaproteobacteria bacterium]
MQRWILPVVFAVSVGMAVYWTTDTHDEPSLPPEPVVVAPVAPPPPKVHTVLHTIAKGETLGTILQNVGLNANKLREIALPVYDLAKLHSGRTLTFKVLEGESIPHMVTYPLNEDNTVTLVREGEQWTAHMETIEYTSVESIREFTVESTFWGAATAAGLRAADIARLATVFEFDVDFNTELRAGAQVRMVVEELYNEGSMVKLGRPLAVKFQNKGEEYVAIHHESDNGDTGYYDFKGASRKKAFLRSPLTFSRISSGFNPKRFHPVLKKRRPHYGTDFAAPTGTPVRASGSGTVTKAGRNGGHGNFVKIDHAGPYASSYSHLHRIKVKRGQKVKQGQVIGTVGTTGLSTGPHLHYQFWKNGKFVDPMKIKLPRNETLPSNEMVTFTANRDTWFDFLEGVTPEVAMSEQ